MSIDVTQFHAIFYEESYEGLELMESGLLQLDLAAPDMEEINAIFRAAHSIKGGSGSFGFEGISEFTHVMETLLDQVRAGERQLSEVDKATLLSSVDALRSMLDQQKENGRIEPGVGVAVIEQLNRMLSQDDSTSPLEEAVAAAETPSLRAKSWRIIFEPDLDLMMTGNDPHRIFKELETLGRFSSKLNISGLPSFGELVPEECYLSWELSLEGDIAESCIREAFEWVEDDCKLELTALDEIAQQPEAGVPLKTQSVAPGAVTAPVIANGDTVKHKDIASIRVNTDKVDDLINLVGELVITQAMLSEIGSNPSSEQSDLLTDGLEQLERNTRELQESVMQIRMMPIGFSFNRFPRLVHDLSAKLGKKVELTILGEATELDKAVLEKISDPLVHLVRNCLDHGLETPEKRIAAGKPETGVLELNAFHRGGNIVIKVSDDGNGLDTQRICQKAIEKGLVADQAEHTEQEIHELIFRPGFSTNEAVNDLSGRGVGMDVVKRNISDLGGSVDVKSKAGEGSTFTIKLPLTLAILDGQLVRVGDQTYIIPLISVVESLPIEREHLHVLKGKGVLYRLREAYVPIIRLHEAFNIRSDSRQLEDGILVVAEGDSGSTGIFVDELLGQQQVVIKSLKTNYGNVLGISSATILGNGSVALILDIPGLLALSRIEALAAEEIPQLIANGPG